MQWEPYTFNYCYLNHSFGATNDPYVYASALRVGLAQSESFEALANSSQSSPELISKLRSDDSKGMRVPEPKP